MGDRALDIVCIGVMCAAMFYVDWSVSASHRRTVEAYERTIQFFRDIADQEKAP